MNCPAFQGEEYWETQTAGRPQKRGPREEGVVPRPLNLLLAPELASWIVNKGISDGRDSPATDPVPLLETLVDTRAMFGFLSFCREGDCVNLKAGLRVP